MALRNYQWDAICAIWEYFKSGNTGNPVVAMPTGTGKSHVIGGFIRTVFDAFPNQRVMVLTHVKELIEQNHNKLLEMWPTAPAGIYSSGLNKRDLYSSITFAGIGSVIRRAEEFGHIDILMIDEAHLVSNNETTMYQKFISLLLIRNPYLKVVGLTATPYRLTDGMLTDEGGLFTDICFDLTTMEQFNKLVSEGYICPLIPKKTDLYLNVDGVHVRGGDFIPKELQGAVDKYEITEAAVRESLELGHDRKSWLTFTAGVEHALHTVEMLNGFGITAKAVHSGNKQYKMSGRERDEAILQFKRGEIQALVNNNVLTTGFDHPPIDLILMLRPTSSPGLWVQMLGRGTRPLYAEGFDLNTKEGRLAAIDASDKQNCMVLDFGGNTKRLGPINDPVVPNKKGKKGGEAPVKVCEECDTWVHASVRICPVCGFEFSFQTKLKQGAGTDALIKGDFPVTEEFVVEHITYDSHVKMDKPAILKVTYYCDLRAFSEYVCISYDGPIVNRARQWWKERSETPMPITAEGALELADSLIPATSLRVWTNKKNPEILAYCFDGTHFGKLKSYLLDGPSLQTNKINTPSKIYEDGEIPFGDDIPF